MRPAIGPTYASLIGLTLAGLKRDKRGWACLKWTFLYMQKYCSSSSIVVVVVVVTAAAAGHYDRTCDGLTYPKTILHWAVGTRVMYCKKKTIATLLYERCVSTCCKICINDVKLKLYKVETCFVFRMRESARSTSLLEKCTSLTTNFLKISQTPTLLCQR